MISSIKFKDDYVCFFKGQNFQFKPITLLVGDQGCGKSTLLSLLSSLVTGKSTICDVRRSGKEQTKIMFLDLEHDNPRTGSGGNPYDSKSMLYNMSVKYQSHGEVLVPILEVIDGQSDSLILLDEPETSLSLRSQFKMVDIFERALQKNNQLFLATHNSLFMQSFDKNILSLEHNKYVSYEEFVELEKTSNNFKEEREDKIIKKTKCKMGINCKCANETNWYNNTCENYINTRGSGRRSYSK